MIRTRRKQLEEALSYRVEERNKLLLRGYLHIKIIRCSNLRNLDCNKCIIAPPSSLVHDVSDPFVTVHAGKHRLAKTTLKNDDLNPVWNEDFYVPVAHYATHLRFAVRDDDFNLYDELIGETFLPVEELVKFSDENKPLRVGVHKIAWLNKKPRHGSLEFFVDYLPLELLSPMPMEVPGVYFPQQSGNRVKLYVNADDGKPGLPKVTYGSQTGNGSGEIQEESQHVWKPPRLWRDTYDSICQAKHLIYITGWSVDVNQSLLRGDEKDVALKNGKYSPFLGELLKQKADEGVAVHLLVWVDVSSHMGTKYEIAKRFFQNTKAIFRLVAMLGDDKNRFDEHAGQVIMFTHHQKAVILDSPRTDDSNKRELLAFVGGIDLTNGRYDTHEHPLFRSQTTIHEGDCHNACFNVDASKTGPREPWHDIHCSVRGPGAMDVLKNFTERWNMQVNDVSLVDVEGFGLANPPAYTGKDSWCTQLFRSIDARTAQFDEAILSTFESHSIDDLPGVNFAPALKKEKGARRFSRIRNKEKQIGELHRIFVTPDASTFQFDRCLKLKKGRNIDVSAHAGILHHIRRAEHSVYIEGQYFLSSSHMWRTSSNTKCGNLIASALTLKICAKIEANEPFAVYIVIPMWPEGIPGSSTVQAILRFQHLTMESMYRRIAAALHRRKDAAKKKGAAVPTAHPRDYLNFYCLANRETTEGSVITSTPWTADEKLLQKTRRHPIYVHSKMVIVDDAIALIGSANINQRSLDGARDSELVLGSWQPEHLATKDSIAQGEVHGFRLHCWASIMGRTEDIFRYPASVACVSRVNQIAEENWKTYCDDQVQEMHSYLVPYPVSISEDGSVKAKTKGGCFPDTRGKITGTKSSILPEILLT